MWIACGAKLPSLRSFAATAGWPPGYLLHTPPLGWDGHAQPWQDDCQTLWSLMSGTEQKVCQHSELGRFLVVCYFQWCVCVYVCVCVCVCEREREREREREKEREREREREEWYKLTQHWYLVYLLSQSAMEIQIRQLNSANINTHSTLYTPVNSSHTQK